MSRWASSVVKIHPSKRSEALYIQNLLILQDYVALALDLFVVLVSLSHLGMYNDDKKKFMFGNTLFHSTVSAGSKGCNVKLYQK